MTPEIVARVDAWVADHRPALLVRGRWLVNDWRKACTLWRYRRAKDPGDASGAVASAEAAMVGLLFALVREAWGDGVWRLELVGVEQRDDHSLADALVAALEAAPRPEAAL